MNEPIFYIGLWIFQQSFLLSIFLWVKALTSKNYFIKNNIIKKEYYDDYFSQFFWFLTLIIPLGIQIYIYSQNIVIGLIFSIISLTHLFFIFLSSPNIIISFRRTTRMPVFYFKNNFNIFNPIYFFVIGLFITLMVLLIK